MHLTRHAFHTWLSVRDDVPPQSKPCVIRARGINCVCYMPLAGSRGMRWIRQGHEDRWDVDVGQVHVFPADGRDHVLVLQAEAGYQGFALLLPTSHVSISGTAFSVGAYGLSRRLAVEPGSPLSDCMHRLSEVMHGAKDHEPGATEDVARAMLVRLHEAIGAPPPRWEDHGQAFDALAIGAIVGFVDAHLKEGSHLDDVALLVGLSASHFARKFQQTFGISLQRFVHRRRIRRSLVMLRDHALSIPAVAAELGYSTRSHFMRMFRDITGMTPARYRRNGVPRSG